MTNKNNKVMKANELSCKDLMVGDWVYRPDCYDQVKEIRQNGIVGFDSLRGLIGFSEIEPIPLTPEILEKNGFRIIFDGELYVSYFQDIKSFHIEVKVDKIGIYQKLSMRDGLGNSVTIVECKYVHQLQHALRLCEIEKTIEL